MAGVVAVISILLFPSIFHCIKKLTPFEITGRGKHFNCRLVFLYHTLLKYIQYLLGQEPIICLGILLKNKDIYNDNLALVGRVRGLFHQLP